MEHISSEKAEAVASLFPYDTQKQIAAKIASLIQENHGHPLATDFFLHWVAQTGWIAKKELTDIEEALRQL
jgi:EAL domain-containing protein (putative c-di-GMP-specific phosphodiesterase class I)